MEALIEALIPKVKLNLILTHDEDDGLLRNIIRAALDYAKTYQKRVRWGKTLPPSTEQAVIMLASHWYESRDGSTGGFFADNTHASEAVWQTVHRLLLLNRNVVI
jgi:uncharacterized phage protein (predicted DNA packaging)